MKTKSPHICALAVLTSCCLALPAQTWAEPQGGAQRAGEVSRVIPAVTIARGSQNITASAKSVVDWKDLINTQVNARARVALDDGSVLNVGSESSMQVVKHDAGAQQTDLELTYGKLRTQAQKIAKPDGKFEVRTPAGVAGVVGTDFYVAYDPGTLTMSVIVFEGLVKVCNLAGVCVIVKAGQMTSVRSGDNSAPTPPVQESLSTLVAVTKETDNGGPVLTGVQSASHVSKGLVWGIIGLSAIPGIVVPIVVTRGHTAAPPTKNPCVPGVANPNCG
jgi:ferric-dicitrate binding protein FerR (iron transport regulator)